jgi:hypothetical protein
MKRPTGLHPNADLIGFIDATEAMPGHLLGYDEVFIEFSPSLLKFWAGWENGYRSGEAFETNGFFRDREDGLFV